MAHTIVLSISTKPSSFRSLMVTPCSFDASAPSCYPVLGKRSARNRPFVIVVLFPVHKLYNFKL